ncbi:hypothetical protein [Trujillonella humicola]|uniref:hypothetical protein n=1 Tax=Trujillonella humicola TaxID=3383699 RepID=UPI0039062DD8
MRLTFTRMADRRAVESLVERDDGVVFAIRGAGGGEGLPHDLVHALVESALDVRDGIWGTVADGAVWTTMRHVSGRRPPHVTARSERLKRERAAAIARAEALADLVHRLADGAVVLPGEVDRGGVPADRLHAAVEALREAGRRWAALRAGEVWVQEWPAARVAGRRTRS